MPFVRKYLPYGLIVTILSTAGFFWLRIPKVEAAFTYYSPVTVNGGQVPSAQTNFPMLVNYTDNRLKTTPTGHVANSNGYDIRPYSDTSCSTALTYQLERYTASTGEVIMWVKIASIANGSVIYLCYGDAALNTDGSSTGTWDANYLAVYHFADGTSLNVNDGTSNAYNLTNNGSWGAAAGQVDGATAKSDPASSQYFSNASIASPNSITVSFWEKVLTGDPQTDAVFDFTDGSSCFNASPRLLSHAPYTDNNIYWDYGDATGGQGRVSTSYASYLDAWTYVTEVYDSSSHLHAIYLNGASAVSDTFTTSNPSCTGIWINKIATNSGKRQLDEFRISNSARPANWITAEYNNQSAPTTFATLGTENSVGGATAAANAQASFLGDAIFLGNALFN